MVVTKTSGVLLLQAAAFFSGVAARCTQACSPDDPVLVLLRSDDAALPFCSDFLGLPVSTVSATVTPTVVATVTETSYVTEVVTEIDSTVTVTVPASTTTLAPIKRNMAKRSVAYPTWLPTTYLANRVSSACACLSVPLSVATNTATAEAVTLTAPVTVTETTTNILHSTVIVTETAKPLVSKRRATIEILRKDTQASVGWLFNSNGLAITSNAAQAIPVNFTLTPGATTGSAVRIYLEDMTPLALGFVKTSNPTNVVDGSLAAVQPTPPGSPPVASGSDKYESDIWTVDTETRIIGWQWVATSGALPTIHLYRVGGRLYPVGNVNDFMVATGGVSSSKYEVVFRYSVVSES
ncbi:hypothetical protein QBC33DRAFT_595440 [Phialemonium atrogriseum]|uniref:Uncharacterized protein n=1 Tax=Phialemonium atrogriseum TaxID=1093897 RepID=A0AAJ0FD39_9PEZI|nr:uncharacterized protein QBC33DRAFT_595440 [Phialemonium atrogriseum]KAK1764216.1 hypothetical protein QBC33DRAFT_595440 [Phialemonium atrogriseum]